MKLKKSIILLGLLLTSTFILANQITLTKVTSTEYVDVVVLLKPGVEVNFPNLVMTHQYSALNGFSARIPTVLYNVLANSWFVSSIQIDRQITISQDTLDWGVDDVDAEEVWGGAENAVDVVAGNVAGQGVKVAIIDTGIDYTHPDLDGVYAGGYDFVANDNDPKDENGHGTHCAGIVAAEDNGEGVIGVAPKTSIYAIRALDAYGSGSVSNIVAGIDWCINNNMDIISMSLGSSSPDSTLEDAVSRAYNAGIVVVAASGNDGKNAISYPAKYADAIAVGAIDSNHNLASFSNYGPEQEVVAPGVDIYSTMPTYTVTLNSWWYGGLSKNYDQMSGTSMATPMVAGVCALILSANPNLSPGEVRNILHDTAVDLGTSGWDQNFGYGEVDALEAVNAAGGGTPGNEPPAKVTGLTATTLSDTEIKLDWNANTEPDLDHYNVYRDGVKIAETTTNTYTDTGLQPGTTYTYEVSAVDDQNAEGPKSDPASATTTGTAINSMHVYSIDMWSEPVYWWIFLLGYDVYIKVTVYDNTNNPLEGVTVYLELTLPSGSIASGSADTGADGTVTFVYERGGSGTYTATVTNLEKTGYTYDSNSNVETSETLVV
ncbi:MAG: S8 family serine peptidase [Candidatus Heimdallarchaeota archaeon]|nr:S8 family serine peptidase [Candidatus Heimdallarchaeota archaeon]